MTDSRWPPAHFDAGGLSGLFHRLDSAYQSFSASGAVDGDTDSLLDSGSEVESLPETAKHKEQSARESTSNQNTYRSKYDDTKLNVESKKGHTNVAFTVGDEQSASTDGHLGTRL